MIREFFDRLQRSFDVPRVRLTVEARIGTGPVYDPDGLPSLQDDQLDQLLQRMDNNLVMEECNEAFLRCCEMINRLDALPNGGSDAALKNKTLGRIANDRVMSVPERTQMLRRLYFRTKKLVLKLEAANG